MKNSFRFATLVACLASALACGVTQAQTKPATNANDNVIGYEQHLVGLLKSGLNYPRLPHGNEAAEPANPVLQRFIDKFERHEMDLKNVVYRADHKTIRITWADAKDNYVVKQTYATGADAVLENSKYADKTNPADTKIMYRDAADGPYKYVQIIALAGPGNTKQTYVDERPTDERCNFCHILVKPADSSSNGVFFKRYQANGNGFQFNGKVGNFFDIGDFKRMESNQDAPNFLPKMSEPFYYRLAKMDLPEDADKARENARVLRTLIEIPHLMEVYAVDNQKSICVGVDFGINAQHGFGKNDYICADNKAKKIEVHFTNAMLYGEKTAKVYSEPYIDFKNVAAPK